MNSFVTTMTILGPGKGVPPRRAWAQALKYACANRKWSAVALCNRGHGVPSAVVELCKKLFAPGPTTWALLGDDHREWVKNTKCRLDRSGNAERSIEKYFLAAFACRRCTAWEASALVLCGMNHEPMRELPGCVSCVGSVSEEETYWACGWVRMSRDPQIWVQMPVYIND
jgi:hypothetical protein